jgi:hypothetical protein
MKSFCFEISKRVVVVGGRARFSVLIIIIILMSRALAREFDSSDDEGTHRQRGDAGAVDEKTLPRIPTSPAPSKPTSKSPRRAAPAASTSPRPANSNVPQGTLLPPILPATQPPPIPPDIGDDDDADVEVTVKTYADNGKPRGGRRRKGRSKHSNNNNDNDDDDDDDDDGEASGDDAFTKFVGGKDKLLSPRSGSKKSRSDIGYIKADAKRGAGDNV